MSDEQRVSNFATDPLPYFLEYIHCPKLDGCNETIFSCASTGNPYSLGTKTPTRLPSCETSMLESLCILQ